MVLFTIGNGLGETLRGRGIRNVGPVAHAVSTLAHAARWVSSTLQIPSTASASLLRVDIPYLRGIRLEQLLQLFSRLLGIGNQLGFVIAHGELFA